MGFLFLRHQAALNMSKLGPNRRSKKLRDGETPRRAPRST